MGGALRPGIVVMRASSPRITALFRAKPKGVFGRHALKMGSVGLAGVLATRPLGSVPMSATECVAPHSAGESSHLLERCYAHPAAPSDI